MPVNNQPGANAVATFLRLSRPINFSPIPIAAAVSNIQLVSYHGRTTALCTGLLATGLALSATYAGIFKGGEHEQRVTSSIPIQWLEYPADYVPPVMDLFAEDEVPLGHAPHVCPKDYEHLERALGFLKYQHLFKTHGVPLDNQDILLVQPLRILGNTSSGSPADVISTLPCRFDALSNGGDSAYDSSSSYSKFGYIMAMTTVFGLLATYWSRLFLESAARTTIAERSWDDDWNCTFNEEPRLVVGILINPDQPIEQLFEEDPLEDTYTPYIVLKFYNECSHSRSLRKEDLAPDGFAALFDAPQDALPSLKELRNMAKGLLLNLPRFVVFGLAIISCFALHVMVFFVTGRFGRRGIRRLVKDFKKSVTQGRMSQIIESATVAPIVPDSPALVNNIVKTSFSDATGTISLPINPIASGSPTPAVRIASSSALVDEAVETSLAPVVNEGELYESWTTASGDHGHSGKGKAPAVIPASEEEPVDGLTSETPLHFMTPTTTATPRKRGRRGRGRGRR